MEEKYIWQVTLVDGTVVNEDQQRFDLSWEEPGKIKKIEIIGEKELSCDLVTKTFNLDGKTIDFDIDGDVKLFFRKRRVMSSEGVLYSNKYIFGFVYGSDHYVAAVEAVPDKEDKIYEPDLNVGSNI